jgi:hypothetical protein
MLHIILVRPVINKLLFRQNSLISYHKLRLEIAARRHIHKAIEMINCGIFELDVHSDTILHLTSAEYSGCSLVRPPICLQGGNQSPESTGPGHLSLKTI